MNTRKRLWVSVILTTSCLAACSTLEASQRGVQLLLAGGVVGQTTKQSAADARKESTALMTRAREALKAGDLTAAESLIVRAEKLNVTYSVLHLGDTPKKLRAQLVAAQRSAKKQGVTRPSQQYVAELPEEKQARDPNDGEVVDATRQGPTATYSPDEEAPLTLPESAGQIRPLPGPQRLSSSPDDELITTALPKATAPAASPAGGGNPQLLAARKALAVGDVRRATAAVEAAKQAKVNYGLHDDTPERVENAIRDYRQVMELLNAEQESDAARHQLAGVLLDQAQQLMRWKDFDEAERLTNSVKSLNVTFGPFEVKPETLMEKIASARRKNGVAPAGAVAGGEAAYPAAQAVYDQQHDTTHNAQVGVDVEAPAADESDEAPPEPVGKLPEPIEEPQPIAAEPAAEGGAALELFRAGERALQARDLAAAKENFAKAYELREQLEPGVARRLQDHLQLLSAPARPGVPEGGTSLIDDATGKQQLLAKQLLSDVAQQQVASGKLREKDPKKAMELLKQVHGKVETSGVDPQVRDQLLRRVDRSIEELDKYIVANRAQIELDSSNKEILADIDRRRQAKVEVGEKLAQLVEEFNKMMDEERWAEAEVLAKRARELAPENPLTKQLLWQSRFVSRTKRNDSLQRDKEQGVWATLDSVEQSGIPFDDRNPYVMPDAKKWEELTKSRGQRLAERRSNYTERELEIERKLKTPVMLKYHDQPLSEVVKQLATLANVNLHLDSKGLEEEGVSSDTPVTIDLTQEISLKSALNLILEPLHLSYVIKDEALKITSEQLRDGEVYQRIYNVADLVIPIPNFVPNGRTGLAGALAEGYNLSGGAWGGMGGVGGAGTGYLASRDGSQGSGIIDPQLMAQMNQLMPAGASRTMAKEQTPFGPGGMGGGSQADFDTLIDLITTTVKPQTWDEVGGPGSISQFPNNLSLVISQTQDVHEEIVDLLEQLRKNQDLQVTIEVRFITLNDNFFEQIGVDFQANIVNLPKFDPNAPGVVGGISGLFEPVPPTFPFPNFTADLDIPFRQNSFNLATPQFGQPANVANFGFAILSDIEAYLLVNASQGDRRSNVLQAPKVTMFNGQQASVFDQTQSPFVISVIPVVGDFAAAYQPVITVLSEGTALTVQAVVSADRRFVRLTVIPFFSQIGEVSEFTFSGSKTSTTSASEESTTGTGTTGSKASTDDDTTTSEGVTIQLPNFSIVTVSTTVSVPDGGTVLLGGIKRLSEGRNEFGVPILSKLPYINRLFKNVGIGRETQSLMMMVTPRIIIQEEEEERLGIPAP